MLGGHRVDAQVFRKRVRVKRRVPVLAGALVLAVAIAASGVASARPAVARTPEAATLSLSGAHPKDRGYHEGTFTAPAPLCPSGTWLGDSEEEGDGIRDFTCDDGSGTFTADFVGDSEHQTGAKGPWAITGGTESWAKLRGKGTAVTDSSTGPGSSPIVFTSTWTGVIDFDDSGPLLKVKSIKVTGSKAPRARRTVTVSFSAVDNVPANAVTYRVTATSGQYFGVVAGPVTAGQGTATFVFRTRQAADTMQLGIHVLDPWENETNIVRVVKLR